LKVIEGAELNSKIDLTFFMPSPLCQMVTDVEFTQKKIQSGAQVSQKDIREKRGARKVKLE